MLEQRDRLRVRPVQIVEHDAHGHRGRQFNECARDGREEKEPLGLRVGALRLGHVGQPLRQLPCEARKFAAVSLDVSLKEIRGACSASWEHTEIQGS